MARSRISAVAAPLLRSPGPAAAAVSSGRPRAILPPVANGSAVRPRNLHATAAELRPDANPGAVPDALAEKDAKGRTGGGERLGSSSENAPPKPKISNMSVPGGAQEKLTEEQKKEVEQHNKEFEEKHDRGSSAPDDKVDKSFWRG